MPTKATFLLLPLIIFFCHTPSEILAQNCDKKLKDAIACICKDDTNTAIQHLDDYIKACKDDDMYILALLMRGEIYRAKGEMDKSLESFEKALAASPILKHISFEEDTCALVLDITSGSNYVSKHLPLLKCSDVYYETQNFQKSIDLLEKIDRNEIPGYSGCVNGIISIESDIAYRYAVCYFGLKDTLNGINKLVDYAIFNESDISVKLITKLKEILLTQYSQKQISEEIERSIADAKEIIATSSNGITSKSTEYTLFGRKIPYIYMSLKEFKYYATHSKNLAYLRSQ